MKDKNTVQNFINDYKTSFLAKQLYKKSNFNNKKESRKIRNLIIKHNMSFIEYCKNAKREKNTKNMLLIPVEYIEPDENAIYTATDCVVKNEFVKYIKDTADFVPPEDLTKEQCEQMTTEELKKKADMFPLTPQGYGYEFNRWEETLGYNVICLPSYYQYEEVLDFLLNILYEMTFNGTSKLYQEYRRSILDERIEEVNKVKDLPEEEQKKFFKELDWTTLGFTYSKEEEDKIKHDAWVESILNKQIVYKSYEKAIKIYRENPTLLEELEK